MSFISNNFLEGYNRLLPKTSNLPSLPTSTSVPPDPFLYYIKWTDDDTDLLETDDDKIFVWR